ncbi:MAG TPA: RsmG family class I SAM-dependent methyltransferase [Acidimicrobiales bacterium]|nr:RsmG family class I SAM-dependent methyltransferase [Acidimicrobiales bacterium]
MEREWACSEALVEVLAYARRSGFLGPGPLERHLRHCQGFLSAGNRGRRGVVVDLGSGGGVPGLVLALAWPESTVVLLDANERRTRFLQSAAERLGLSAPRVEVVRERAEVVGRQDRWRSVADLVVARGFGPPAVVAECGAPLLSLGGRLIVSEPPGGGQGRWPQTGLSALGLVAGPPERHHEAWYRVMEQRERCPHRFPRRSGVPRKQPLF